jgi:DNA polymerase sigma
VRFCIHGRSIIEEVDEILDQESKFELYQYWREVILPLSDHGRRTIIVRKVRTCWMDQTPTEKMGQGSVVKFRSHGRRLLANAPWSIPGQISFPNLGRQPESIN